MLTAVDCLVFSAVDFQLGAAVDFQLGAAVDFQFGEAVVWQMDTSLANDMVGFLAPVILITKEIIQLMVNRNTVGIRDFEC